MAKRKRRKLTKAQAKEQALRQRKRRRLNWTLAGVVAVAVIVVMALIYLTGGDTNLKEVEPLRADIETGLTKEGYPYRGSADAPVTIVEVSDYKCYYCAEFALETVPLIDDELLATGQARYVVQPFARLEESMPIAEAAACARDQGGFWDFHHLAFANQSLFSSRRPSLSTVLRQLAEAVELDVDEFQNCLDEGTHEQDLLASVENARQEKGVEGTPTFFVNGTMTQLYPDEAYFDTIRKAVEAAASE